MTSKDLLALIHGFLSSHPSAPLVVVGAFAVILVVTALRGLFFATAERTGYRPRSTGGSPFLRRPRPAVRHDGRAYSDDLFG